MQELMQRDEDTCVAATAHRQSQELNSCRSERRWAKRSTRWNGRISVPSGSGGEASARESARRGTGGCEEKWRNSPSWVRRTRANGARRCRNETRFEQISAVTYWRCEEQSARSDDVPIVTPTAQQTEWPADAAEAHRSMGNMELISNVVAKMMNAAVTCELTDVRNDSNRIVWSTFVEVRKQIHKASIQISSYIWQKRDGEYWDFLQRERREKDWSKCNKKNIKSAQWFSLVCVKLLVRLCVHHRVVHVVSIWGPFGVHLGSIWGPFWVHYIYNLNVDAFCQV